MATSWLFPKTRHGGLCEFHEANSACKKLVYKCLQIRLRELKSRPQAPRKLDPPGWPFANRICEHLHKRGVGIRVGERSLPGDTQQFLPISVAYMSARAIWLDQTSVYGRFSIFWCKSLHGRSPLCALCESHGANSALKKSVYRYPQPLLRNLKSHRPAPNQPGTPHNPTLEHQSFTN